MADHKGDRIKQTPALSSEIQQLLHGQELDVVAAVLIDLISKFVAQHVSNSPEHTAEMREGILGVLIDAAREGIPDAEREILTDLDPAGQA